MLTEKEIAFMNRWESAREEESSFRRKLLSGLPMAVLFYLPVPLFLISIYLFLPEWYARVSNRAPGAMVTILIGLAVAVFFFSYFRMHFKWEMNEQLYQQLKMKQSAEISQQNRH